MQPALRPPYLAVALVSAAAIAYELLLIRLFAIVMWHHFAYMAISLALLGFGASGVVLSIVHARLRTRAASVFGVAVVGFSLTSSLAFLLAQRLPFQPEAVIWAPGELVWLALVYVVLAVPFFFAATAIGLALVVWGDRTARVYAADLVGAGAGAVLVVAALALLAPLAALVAVAALGLVAVLVGAVEMRSPPRRTTAMIAVGVAVLVAAGVRGELQPSPFKPLEQQLRVAGSRLVETRSSPLGLLSVVENDRVPLRHAPGLSVAATAGPPEQAALFVDAGAMTAVDRAGPGAAAYLDQTIRAAPYHLGARPKVLVLASGGGADVVLARHHAAREITAVELNPDVVDIVRTRYRAFSGGVYEPPTVVRVGDARGFLTGSRERFDLIQMSLSDAPGSSIAGVQALGEGYLYTVEAFGAYLDHLTDDGVVAITRWLRLPPRDSLKLVNTAVEALAARGVESPGAHVALIRSWQATTFLLKRTPFEREEIDALLRFCDERAFDVAWAPGVAETRANRFNRLGAPVFHRSAAALLGPGREEFTDRYKFDLRPATDDRPYFSSFFRWSVLPEVWGLRERGGAPLVETGYLVLLATLVQAVVLGALLVLVPVWLSRRRPGGEGGRRTGIFLYFLAIGLAFLLVEIAFLQRMVQLLHHPVLAATVTLSTFLVLAGLGSLFGRRYAETRREGRGIAIAVAFILVVGVVELWWTPWLLAVAASWPLAARVALGVALAAPLGFAMGLPFSLGLARVHRRWSAWVPWVWGVNGCASVVSAVAAALVAVHFGYNVVLGCGLALYGVAGVLGAWRRPEQGGSAGGPVPARSAAGAGVTPADRHEAGRLRGARRGRRR